MTIGEGTAATKLPNASVVNSQTSTSTAAPVWESVRTSPGLGGVVLGNANRR